MTEQRVSDERLAAILSYAFKGSENMLDRETFELASDLKDCRAKLADLPYETEAELAAEVERLRARLAEAEAKIEALEDHVGDRDIEIAGLQDARTEAEAREAELREVLADSRPACEWCAGHADDYPTVIQATELLAKIDAALATGGKEGA